MAAGSGGAASGTVSDAGTVSDTVAVSGTDTAAGDFGGVEGTRRDQGGQPTTGSHRRSAG